MRRASSRSAIFFQAPHRQSHPAIAGRGYRANGGLTRDVAAKLLEARLAPKEANALLLVHLDAHRVRILAEEALKDGVCGR